VPDLVGEDNDVYFERSDTYDAWPVAGDSTTDGEDAFVFIKGSAGGFVPSTPYPYLPTARHDVTNVPTVVELSDRENTIIMDAACTSNTAELLISSDVMTLASPGVFKCTVMISSALSGGCWIKDDESNLLWNLPSDTSATLFTAYELVIVEGNVSVIGVAGSYAP
jgi:hypothetical protein